MGQHKHNPTAIAAKNGELPPKPKKMSKREIENLLKAKIMEKTGLGQIYEYLEGKGVEPYAKVY